MNGQSSGLRSIRRWRKIGKIHVDLTLDKEVYNTVKEKLGKTFSSFSPTVNNLLKEWLKKQKDNIPEQEEEETEEEVEDETEKEMEIEKPKTEPVKPMKPIPVIPELSPYSNPIKKRFNRI